MALLDSRENQNSKAVFSIGLLLFRHFSTFKPHSYLVYQFYLKTEIFVWLG